MRILKARLNTIQVWSVVSVRSPYRLIRPIAIGVMTAIIDCAERVMTLRRFSIGMSHHKKRLMSISVRGVLRSGRNGRRNPKPKTENRFETKVGVDGVGGVGES
ncbi:hypothetical protein EBZ38_15240 [bacterium]|nr:hypothetical protein [bacterium]NDD85615.1 hypothetical protein [bacterium]